ncbi:MAG: MG2 domain-containing protein, partial [bacterium]
MKHFRMHLLVLLAAVGFLVLNQVGTAIGQVAVPRDKAVALQQQGNYKEAYDALSKLALDPKDDPNQVNSDLTNAIQCLQNLGRVDEIDAFLENVIAAHPNNWRLLFAAAQSYNNLEHNGFQITGKFSRGYHRGGGKAVNSYERDRVRALQLMAQAQAVANAETDKGALADFYWNQAFMLLGNRGYNEAWRLQYLTDLTVLPDYDEGYWGWYGGNSQRGTPVKADGTPVYYSVPKSWADAQNDGERWRWALQQTMELNPQRISEVRFTFAQFLEAQFGVNTMASYRWYFSQQDREDKNDESGPYELSSLKETETITQFATGIKRFALPDEFNYIKIYQEIAAKDGNTGYGHNALTELGSLFSDRRQYDRSAEYYKLAGDINQVIQILGNWGVFEPVTTQPAGKGATVEFRFRNGSELNLDATEIDTEKLLTDVKAYLKANPKQLDWQSMDIENLGYRLVNQNQKQYLKGDKIAWTEKLAPRPKHFDKRITLTTPLTKAGAYLVNATMKDGNISRIIIWVADTTIVKKPMEKGTFYYVADAVTGAAIPGAKLDFFGYHQDWVNNKNNGGGNYNITTTSVQGTTDAQGQYLGKPLDTNYTWLTTATKDNRLAYLGFSGAWYGGQYDSEYNAMKTFALTDRPVYRPDQVMKFKFWVSQAKYDQGDKSPYAGKSFPIHIYNPKGEKIFEKTYKADEYGGIDGEYLLPKDATLGVYSVQIPYPNNGNSYTGGSITFRVEEYKKPEFEVKVDAPTEPVMLGEKIQATIKANYYFGAPVTDAKVKYKIMRTGYSATWYPTAYWDWFYGPGYWWYGYDYAWYPGWYDWGCARPQPIWWQGFYRNTPQPELVAEVETQIGADGTVKVDIDTALAKAIQGDTDHKYEITAEVTDKSRRTITGAGTVLVARKPFKVYVSVDRGYYRVGDIIQADVNAQTLSNKPVQGKGNLRLLKVSYNTVDGKVTPVETQVQQWALDTNDLGISTLQIKASEAGQYRLSYSLDDLKGHTQEGGYVFTIRGNTVDNNQYRFNDIELIQDKRDYKPGETVNLQINTNQPNSTVLLFTRPANGIYQAPKVLTLNGQSTTEQIVVTQKDMPNFFVEAVTICNGKLYSESREIAVPPVKRSIDVAVTPNSTKYKPGETATVKIKLTDPDGKPVVGTTAITMYDKSLEYISDGSNVPNIKDFYWKWRRSHYQSNQTNLTRGGYNMLLPGEHGMGILGTFGYTVADDEGESGGGMKGGFGGGGGRGGLLRGGMVMENAVMSKAGGMAMPGAMPPPMASAAADGMAGPMGSAGPMGNVLNMLGGGGVPNGVMPTIRKDFADSAFWAPSVKTDANGEATIEIKMPENLTTWKTKVWAMGNGTSVGEGSAESVTSKNVIIRLEAPRFFVQKDEVVLSAVVHNYLSNKKTVKVVLEADGDCLLPMGAFVTANAKIFPPQSQTIEIEPNTDKRVDWRVSVTQPGEATIRMKAITDEESDAMEMK